ncbi:type II toxin-antitoxin system VapC family toxin [Leptolyngbya cf. ectocarpi LEGE 11479]|uniref:Type II toxin-antitoxin system VapC family toxin n=1 Tax=Leptolyngbya cf. ectocarpi LEGE 11479 TaxID=1828722 RepID=A0A929FAN3_LEPEC|nr:type II toxin-antitoxin system VapC family toxin [Leptolyngbya ectocarpi]MBE9068512.1 type II toxin-antitoxin system VapC family toxin [Leptolyngbya cf. ectocarpi LEGE 11479]
MSLLLDTHALIWFLDNNPRLPTSTRSQIETTPTVFVSIASLWEIAIKANIGKLELSAPFSTIEPNLVALGITQLAINFKDLEIYLSLPLHHRDPFDRLLIAQAINHSLSLISYDTQMDAYAIQRLWE